MVRVGITPVFRQIMWPNSSLADLSVSMSFKDKDSDIIHLNTLICT